MKYKIVRIPNDDIRYEGKLVEIRKNDTEKIYITDKKDWNYYPNSVFLSVKEAKELAEVLPLFIEEVEK